jgi:hypothetical protein
VAGRGERVTRTTRRLGERCHRHPRFVVDEAPRGNAPHPARASPESALPATRLRRAGGGGWRRRPSMGECRSPPEDPCKRRDSAPLRGEFLRWVPDSLPLRFAALQASGKALLRGSRQSLHGFPGRIQRKRPAQDSAASGAEERRVWATRPPSRHARPDYLSLEQASSRGTFAAEAGFTADRSPVGAPPPATAASFRGAKARPRKGWAFCFRVIQRTAGVGAVTGLR